MFTSKNISMFNFEGVINWVNSLSERTLSLSAIAILHVAFVPSLLAYLNALTDKLPNLDTFALILLALAIMCLRAIIKKDIIAILVHMMGFIGQTALFAFILLK